MSELTLDHQRARHAEQRVAERFRTWHHQGDREAREYRSVALGATGHLRQTGLAQLLAFWLSKERGAEHKLTQDLMEWLVAGPVTRSICASGPVAHARSATDAPSATLRAAIGADPRRPHDLMGPLLARSSREVALLEAESEAYLLWVRRLTEGRWKALPEKAAAAGVAATEPAGASGATP